MSKRSFIVALIAAGCILMSSCGASRYGLGENEGNNFIIQSKEYHENEGSNVIPHSITDINEEAGTPENFTESIKESALSYLNKNIEEVKRDFGETNTIDTLGDIEYLVYAHEGIMFGHAQGGDEILVVRPYRWRYGEFLNIWDEPTFSSVKEAMGDGEKIIDYTDGEGRIALDYWLEDYSARVVFLDGKVMDLLITPPRAMELKKATVDGEVEPEKDLVTGSVIDTTYLLGFLGSDIEFIRSHIGDFSGTTLQEETFRNKYAYNFNKFGIIYSGDINQDRIMEISFYKNGVFGIEMGMNTEDVEARLGEYKSTEVTHGGLIKNIYKVQRKDKKYSAAVYFDGGKGRVYYITVRESIDEQQ